MKQNISYFIFAVFAICAILFGISIIPTTSKLVIGLSFVLIFGGGVILLIIFHKATESIFPKEA